MSLLLVLNSHASRLISQASFKKWLQADQTFTMPMAGCPLAMNQVAITSVTPSLAGQLEGAIQSGML